MPHLYGCVTRLGGLFGKGLCFHRSIALLYDWKDSELVVGKFRAATPEEQKTTPNASKVPFIHCWAERNGEVYAPSTIEAQGGLLRPMNREGYYKLNGAEVWGRMDIKALRKAAAGTGLASHVRYGTSLLAGEAASNIILKALNIPYGITKFRSIVPVDSPEAVEKVYHDA